MKKIIIFNWKMNPSSLKEAERLFTQTQICADKRQINADIIIAPPFVYLEPLLKSLNSKSYILNFKLCAQDVFWSASRRTPAGGGAYTGEISAKMLKNLGVEYVIIGHSERRKYFGETDEIINKKIKAVFKTGLKVVLCVGENLKIRKKGKKTIEIFIKNQLQKDLKGIKNLKLKIKNLVVAYEPVWAIGAGHSDTSQDALEIIKFIKRTLYSKFYILNSRVLYGGSVDSKNIKDFIQHKEIDGVLVGGASLRKNEIIRIFAQIR